MALVATLIIAGSMVLILFSPPKSPFVPGQEMAERANRICEEIWCDWNNHWTFEWSPPETLVVTRITRGGAVTSMDCPISMPAKAMPWKSIDSCIAQLQGEPK